MISFNLSTLIDIAPALQALVIDLLAAIIAIRTLLSLTLEVEMTGRWPRQRGAEKQSETLLFHAGARGCRGSCI